MKYALVDGYSLVFRAYHAIPPDLATSKGEQTNAVYGFCNMLIQILQREAPTKVAVAFDVGKAFRHEEYKEYKAHRPSMPDDLGRQMDRVREVVRAFDFPIYEARGYEADDVIGSLAARLEEQGHEATIVTGDTDLLQLVTERIRVATPSNRGFSDVRIYDPAAVRERYGFEPHFVADYKALVGDTSDNIPGVPGIGDKTARTLIQTYGDVEKILERLDEVRPERVRRAIEENTDRLRQSKRLATIVTTVELDLPQLLEAKAGYDRQGVTRVFRDLEFRSLVNRLPELEPHEVEPEPLVEDTVEARYATLDTPEKVREVVQGLLTSDVIAFDTETDSKSAVGAELVGVSFCGEEGVAYYVPTGHDELEVDREGLLRELRPLLEGGPEKVAHNAKYDCMVLQQQGITVAPLGFDTSLAAFLLNESAVDLKSSAAARTGMEMKPIEFLIGRGKSQKTMAQVPVADATRYAAADADATLRLYHIYEPELRQRGQLSLLNDLEMPLVPVLADMELAGISIDTAALQQLSTDLYRDLQQIEEGIRELAGSEVNLRSPQQLSKLLFSQLGLKGGRKTSTGGYSTDVHTLEALSGQHPIIDLLLSYRQISKLKDTYVDALPLLVNKKTGRVHTSFNQTVASTGRLSSSDPNLQNIPVRREQGREVRRAFIASDSPENSIMPGPTVLLSTDYSQIELRVLAHITGEERLQEAFARDEDIHALTASQLYDVPLDEVTTEMRRTGKTINFGIIYGMTGFRLARDTGLSQKKAAEFVRLYMEQFPRIKALFDETVRKAEERGYVETALGRRRYFPDINSSNPQRREAARRAAVNMPIQGMAADIMKQAMIDVFAALRQSGLRARMLLQVHDELLLEVAEDELQDTAQLVGEKMSTAVKLSVPVKTDAKWGKSWGDMQPVMVATANR